jgi:lipoprotein-anchoring transpeptidase ErfK/SrfK
VNASLPAPRDGLPYQYYFVGDNGTLAYRDFLSAEQGYPDAELEPGFVVAIQALREQNSGDPFGLTTRDLWVPLRDLRPVAPSSFQGVMGQVQELAWVTTEAARAYDKPAGRAVAAPYPRLASVRIRESRVVRGKTWSRVSDEHWLRQEDLAYRTEYPAPIGLLPQERWIDVDIEQQVLTAFEGRQPVFSTLISAGRGTGDAENATPKGEHRIWVKLQSSDMDNLEDREASRYYAIQSVPWVMYFDRGYGLHGAFWHRDFGHVRSHGCVNLSPLDAHWLFSWTSPRMPTGWSAVFPTDYERGTLVRVR